MYPQLPERPLVTIITPTYNHERYIGQCIESVLAQTYGNWEMIIVDDGSKDSTGQVIDTYRDSRITHVAQANIGIWRLGETYNKALKMAKGELIAVLEGDDFWPHDKLEKELRCFADRDVVLSWGKVAIYYNGGVVRTYPDRPSYFVKKTGPEGTRSLLDANFVPACTAICRKDALLDIGGFRQESYTPFVDYTTWLSLSMVGTICGVDEVMGYWRTHDLQMTASNNLGLIADRFSLDFYRRLPPETQKSLGITEKKLQANLENHDADNEFYKGKAALRRKEWAAARAIFAGGLRRGSPVRRIKSLAGILFSYLRTDFDRIENTRK